jgi:small subunit ribosomal protein S21
MDGKNADFLPPRTIQGLSMGCLWRLLLLHVARLSVSSGNTGHLSQNKTPKTLHFSVFSATSPLTWAQDTAKLKQSIQVSWEVYSYLAEVRLQEGEPLENALRRFKRKVQQEDIIKEVKRHSFYLKPGEKRRVKEALARKRNRKKARKEQD